jgi:LemA protein
MKKKSLISLLGIIVVLVLGGYFIGTYNSLASAENDVDAKWSQVENVMQRRADLIPNLVNSVQGSMNQENKIIEKITEARKEYNNASSPQDKVNANEKLGENAQTILNIIQENYPQLTSNENVKTLMVQLEGADNRISVARKAYIEEVQKYNQGLVRFPRNIVAKTMGFEKKANFKADDKAKEVPDVQFE